MVRRLKCLKGELVRYGDQIAADIVAKESGQIVGLDKDTIRIRSAHPYLVSSGAILQTKNQELVQMGDTLAILVFERSKDWRYRTRSTKN